MIYVALLRGINVGGHNKVAMADLKVLFEELGAQDVTTILNTGNVVFKHNTGLESKVIQEAIQRRFNMNLELVIFDFTQIESLHHQVPDSWVTDKTVRTDVMLYLDEVMPALEIGDVETIRSDIALVWHWHREENYTKGPQKIIGTPFYKRITIRNANTLRKIYQTMLYLHQD